MWCEIYFPEHFLGHGGGGGPTDCLDVPAAIPEGGHRLLDARQGVGHQLLGVVLQPPHLGAGARDAVNEQG